jgi:hypothetical protein
MEFIPFHVLNDALVKRLRRVDLYTDPDYSFLKIVQHGLSYSMLKTPQKLLRTYFHLPFFIQCLLMGVKGLVRKSKIKPVELKQNVLLDEGRIFEESSGEIRSMYFSKLKGLLTEKKCTHIRLGGDKRLAADFQWSDFPVHEGFPDKIERKMLLSIRSCIAKLKSSGEFSADEMRYIDSAFSVFYSSFRQYYHIFKNTSAQRVFFCVHYHKEGLLAAMKTLGIKAIELQHGLISKNDFYYVYDKQFSSCIPKAFFPDSILLYGTYWQRVLMSGAEWNSKQLIVAGNYLANAQKGEGKEWEKENIIFIGAQKNLAKQYVDYCLALQKQITSKKYSWRIVIKMHPLEKTPEVYLSNLPDAGIQVLGSESNLFEWLSKSRIQISIYSTTFFDALGFDVVNFSIQNYTNSADYAKEMVEEGVALPLRFDEDPIEIFENRQTSQAYLLHPSEVYAQFPTPEVLALIEE